MSAITCPYRNDTNIAVQGLLERNIKKAPFQIKSLILDSPFNSIREKSARSIFERIDQDIIEVKDEWERINKFNTVEGEEARYIIEKLIPEAREFTKEEARLHEESIDEMFKSTGRNIFDL